MPFEFSQICVTLYDWEHIAERFEKATHYHEKALYKMLNDFIIPPITGELRVRPCIRVLIVFNRTDHRTINRKLSKSAAWKRQLLAASARLDLPSKKARKKRYVSLRPGRQRRKRSEAVQKEWRHA